MPSDESDFKRTEEISSSMAYLIISISRRNFFRHVSAEDNVKEWGLLVIECVHVIDPQLVQNR